MKRSFDCFYQFIINCKLQIDLLNCTHDIKRRGRLYMNSVTQRHNRIESELEQNHNKSTSTADCLWKAEFLKDQLCKNVMPIPHTVSPQSTYYCDFDITKFLLRFFTWSYFILSLLSTGLDLIQFTVWITALIQIA